MPQTTVGVDFVGDPVVGLANSLELVVVGPSPGNVDWIASVPTMEVRAQSPYDWRKELFFVMSPNLVSLVGEIRRFSAVQPDLVLNDLFQSALFDPANHQTFPIRRSGHPLHGTDSDIFLVLACVMWFGVLVVLSYQ